jgi:hypothetical protein
LEGICGDGSDGGPGKVDIGSGNVPPNPGVIFDPGTHTVVTGDPNKTPALVYPVSETMFPQNIYRVLFQWKKAGLTLYQISFDSPVLKVNVYTDGVHAVCTQAANGGACWESDVMSWRYLAASNAGQAISFKIRGVESPTAKIIYESPAYVIRFSEKAVPGAIYYWSTTAQGVRRGAMGDPAPQNFLTPDEAQGKCVACHTLSRNGKKLAADIGGETLASSTSFRPFRRPLYSGPSALRRSRSPTRGRRSIPIRRASSLPRRAAYGSSTAPRARASARTWVRSRSARASSRRSPIGHRTATMSSFRLATWIAAVRLPSDGSPFPATPSRR